MTESQIEAKLVRYCREHGLYTRKFVSPANRGVPDRIIAGHGRILFLELKRPGNTTTALQDYELAQLRKHGLNAHVATGFEEARNLVFKFIEEPAKPIPSLLDGRLVTASTIRRFAEGV